MNAAPKTALASRFAMKARRIKVLAHALPRTWGQPCGVRQPAPRSYDSLARGGSLYPLTAGARGKYGGTYSIRNGAKYMKNTNSLSAPINSSGEQVCVLDGCIVRVRYKDCPDKVSVMANVRGILLNSYRRDNIAAEDRV